MYIHSNSSSPAIWGGHFPQSHANPLINYLWSRSKYASVPIHFNPPCSNYANLTHCGVFFFFAITWTSWSFWKSKSFHPSNQLHNHKICKDSLYLSSLYYAQWWELFFSYRCSGTERARLSGHSKITIAMRAYNGKRVVHSYHCTQLVVWSTSCAAQDIGKTFSFIRINDVRKGSFKNVRFLGGGSSCVSYVVYCIASHLPSLFQAMPYI